jgi:DNA-binding NarL/FixJ family response regulator
MIPHILIIDADASAAQTTRALIARVAPGALLMVEPTAEQGRRCIQHQPVDVLIIDPVPHSLADERLIRTVKAAQPAARILVLAAESTPGSRRRMADLGIDAYLEKREPPDALVERLRAAIGRCGARG